MFFFLLFPFFSTSQEITLYGNWSESFFYNEVLLYFEEINRTLISTVEKSLDNVRKINLSSVLHHLRPVLSDDTFGLLNLSLTNRIYQIKSMIKVPKKRVKPQIPGWGAFCKRGKPIPFYPVKDFQWKLLSAVETIENDLLKLQFLRNVASKFFDHIEILNSYQISEDVKSRYLSNPPKYRKGTYVNNRLCGFNILDSTQCLIEETKIQTTRKLLYSSFYDYYSNSNCFLNFSNFDGCDLNETYYYNLVIHDNFSKNNSNITQELNMTNETSHLTTEQLEIEENMKLLQQIQANITANKLRYAFSSITNLSSSYYTTEKEPFYYTDQIDPRLGICLWNGTINKASIPPLWKKLKQISNKSTEIMTLNIYFSFSSPEFHRLLDVALKIENDKLPVAVNIFPIPNFDNETEKKICFAFMDLRKLGQDAPIIFLEALRKHKAKTAYSLLSPLTPWSNIEETLYQDKDILNNLIELDTYCKLHGITSEIDDSNTILQNQNIGVAASINGEFIREKPVFESIMYQINRHAMRLSNLIDDYQITEIDSEWYKNNSIYTQHVKPDAVFDERNYMSLDGFSIEQIQLIIDDLIGHPNNFNEENKTFEVKIENLTRNENELTTKNKTLSPIIQHLNSSLNEDSYFSFNHNIPIIYINYPGKYQINESDTTKILDVKKLSETTRQFLRINENNLNQKITLVGPLRFAGKLNQTTLNAAVKYVEFMHLKSLPPLPLSIRLYELFLSGHRYIQHTTIRSNRYFTRSNSFNESYATFKVVNDNSDTSGVWRLEMSPFDPDFPIAIDTALQIIESKAVKSVEVTLLLPTGDNYIDSMKSVDYSMYIDSSFTSFPDFYLYKYKRAASNGTLKCKYGVHRFVFPSQWAVSYQNESDFYIDSIMSTGFADNADAIQFGDRIQRVVSSYHGFYSINALPGSYDAIGITNPTYQINSLVPQLTVIGGNNEKVIMREPDAVSVLTYNTKFDSNLLFRQFFCDTDNNYNGDYYYVRYLNEFENYYYTINDFDSYSKKPKKCKFYNSSTRHKYDDYKVMLYTLKRAATKNLKISLISDQPTKYSEAIRLMPNHIPPFVSYPYEFGVTQEKAKEISAQILSLILVDSKYFSNVLVSSPNLIWVNDATQFERLKMKKAAVAIPEMINHRLEAKIKENLNSNKHKKLSFIDLIRDNFYIFRKNGKIKLQASQPYQNYPWMNNDQIEQRANRPFHNSAAMWFDVSRWRERNGLYYFLELYERTLNNYMFEHNEDPENQISFLNQMMNLLQLKVQMLTITNRMAFCYKYNTKYTTNKSLISIQLCDDNSLSLLNESYQDLKLLAHLEL